MTHRELYDQVLHLGFETTALEIDEAYVDAVNRAIYQVNALRPRIGYADILHFPQKDMLGGRYAKLTEVVNGVVTFPVSGCKELSLNIAGSYERYNVNINGNIMREDIVNSNDFSTLKPKTITIGDNVKEIILQAKPRFIYENAAAYLNQHSNNRSRPGTHYTAYDIIGATALCNPPISKAEGYQFITEDGYRVEGTNVLIKNELTGIYRIAYYVMPTLITKNDYKSDSQSILLDDDLCALLPLVVGSYIWLEDEPERSQLYYNRYAEQAQMILRKGRVQTPTKYVTNGW